MRIVVWGINFAPEVTGIGPHNTALCEFLKKRGHDVEMVTAFPYYPSWEKLPTDRRRIFRTDTLNGIPVHRCWHYVPRTLSSWRRILHELSFTLTSAWRFLSLPRADLAIVISPPLLLGAAAWFCGAVKKTRFVFHVQDLQPDGALGLGMLKQRLFIRMLRALEALAYRKAWRVSGISRGMLEAFGKKSVPLEKIICFPNTIKLAEADEYRPRGAFRSAHGFGDCDFLAVQSGNLGVKHGLQILTDAAPFLKNSRIKILICGEGSARDSIAQAIARGGLENTVLLPLQSDADYRAMLADADLCLVTQRQGSAQSFFPSKLLNALAFAKPVLTVADADSELARAVREGNFGVNVAPGQPQALAQELERLAESPALLAELAGAGKKYVAQFDRERVFSEFADAIEAGFKSA
jgi:colanic acid biosynthesis glycosyl transferase WcaI